MRHLTMLLLAACSPGEPINPYIAAEQEAMAAYEAALLTLSGRVLDEDGAGVSGASVSLDGRSTTADADGRWTLSDVPRHNALLIVSAGGLRPQVQPIHLARPLSVDAVEADATVLADQEGTRFLWTGDFMLGRRFLDPGETAARDEVPAEDPDALLSVSSPADGSLDAIRYAAPLFETADFPVVNLESAVTDSPDTPHATKDYVYFTLPDSLVALTDLGISYVNLGNNHVYDYLEPGLIDTMDHLDAAGLGYSGAGLTVADALAPWRVTLGGQTYAFLAASSINGDEHLVSYVAEEGKGGSASLDDLDLLVEQIEAEVAAGNVPIVQIHSGYEYTYTPSSFTRGIYESVSEAGAALVVGNHTHIAQGFGWTESGALALHCLGNFVFDQDRSDTMLGALVETQLHGADLLRSQMVPVYLEDYRPRMATGALSDRFLRRAAESSDDNLALAIYADRLWMLEADEVVETERTESVTVTVGSDGVAIVDLRDHLQPGESVASLSIPGASAVQPGRDLLLFGSFEDEDIDEDAYEAARWDLTSESRETCFTGARSGVLGLCTYRSEASIDDVVAPFRNRVRVWGDGLHDPNKDVTLFGYLHGEGAGATTAVVRYSASVGDNEFGEESFAISAGGDQDWTPFAFDLTIPDDTSDPEAELLNPRAMRLFLRHAPAEVGWGRAAFDDLAIISWEEVLSAEASLTTPHPREFLRVTAAPGSYTLSLTLTAPRPAGL